MEVRTKTKTVQLNNQSKKLNIQDRIELKYATSRSALIRENPKANIRAMNGGKKILLFKFTQLVTMLGAKLSFTNCSFEKL